MSNALIVLEYFKVFLSPQIIICSALIIFSLIFKNEISRLIDRIVELKFPGGSAKAESQAARKNQYPTIKEKIENDVEKELNTKEEIKFNKEQLLKILNLINSLRVECNIWEYRYLNYYFVNNTQNILDWLINLPQDVTISLFDSVWQPIIPSVEERNAILGALATHHLILIDGEIIKVTEKGRKYAKWPERTKSVKLDSLAYYLSTARKK